MIKIEGISVPVEIVRSSRKTLGVQVNADGSVTARAPMRMSESRITEFLQKKAGWIEAHVKKSLSNSGKLEKLEPFSPEEIHEMAEKALKVIPERAKYFAALIGVTYSRITIRNQKTKWGSCSSKGNLNFNCLLMMTPPEVIDSVVVHELCHRKHMNHSKEFYEEIYRVFPDYDKWDKWLRENGSLLIRRMTGE